MFANMTYYIDKNYTTRKIHTKLHPGLEWRIFHIPTSEDIDDFADIKFLLNCTLIRWCIIEASSGPPRKSSVIFGNFRKMLGNIRATFGQILHNLPKVVGNLRKIANYAVISMSI